MVSFNHALTHGVVLSIPIAANFIQDQSNLDYFPVFLPISLFLLMYGFGAVMAGYIIDKIGAMKPTFLGLAVTAISMLALGLSGDLLWFSIWVVVAGFGVSFAHPTGLTIVSNLFVKNRGKAMGTFGFLGQFGQVLPPLAIGAIGTFFYWNLFFLLLFLLYLIALISCAILLKTDISKEQEEKHEDMEYKKAIIGLFSGLIGLILLLTAFRGIHYRGVTSVVTFYTNDVLNLDIFTGSIFLSIMLASGFPAQLLGGWLTDKHGPVRPLLIFSVLPIFGVLLCLIVNLWTFILGLLIIGFSFFCAQPAENVLISKVGSLNVRGMLFGLKFLVSFGASFTAPLVMGYFADIFTLNIVFYILLIFALLTMAVVFRIAIDLAEAIVVYDTKFGNTKKVAEDIALGFEDEGVKVRIKDVKKTRKNEIPKFDLMVLGAPTHINDAKKDTKKFLKRLKSTNLSSVKFAAFDTRITNARKGASMKIESILTELGASKLQDGLTVWVSGMRGPLEEGSEEKSKTFGSELAKKIK
jgi:MFS family permease